MKKKRNYKEEFRVLVVLIIIAFTVKTSIAEIYVVPTGSMERTILVGDMLFGNKFIYGMRTPNWLGVPYTRMGFDIPSWRLPNFKEVESGDVVIFEFPRDPFQKYVKRCIGTPADNVVIDSGQVYINNELMEFPVEGQFLKGYIKDKDKESFNLYPDFKRQNEDNISEFKVPYKGMKINFENVDSWESIITLLVLDLANVSIGKYSFTYVDPLEIGKTRGFLKYTIMKAIMNPAKVRERQNNDIRNYVISKYREYADQNILNPWKGPLEDFNVILDEIYNRDSEWMLENVLIDGVSLGELKTYSLKHDYYFMVGDNRDNSYDSRFWGFVPDYHVLGTPVFSVINLNFAKNIELLKPWTYINIFKLGMID